METRKVAYNELNGIQRRVIGEIIDGALYRDYEIKYLNIEEFYGEISVVLEVGMQHDEGTMAAVICRDTYIFWVGKKGGVYQYEEKKKGGYRKVYRKYGIVKRQKY